ncbi:MAG: hypothetical protein ACM30H_13730 [Clostridia bacterium]
MLMRAFPFLVAVLATGTAAAAAPGPDPRLEQALNTGPIAAMQRSVDFTRTVPQVVKRKPEVDPGRSVRVAEDVYVDPALAPKRPARDDERAIRIYRRDR